jgi:hypothetical protein
MKPFPSSPLSDLAEASALHFFIVSCWVMGAADAPALMWAFAGDPRRRRADPKSYKETLT